MSKKGLLAADNDRRSVTIFHAATDGKKYIETRQDCEPMIEAAKVLAEVPPDEDGWRFVGVIPDHVFNQACVEGWLHDKAKWRAWMRDRDNRQFNGGRENPF